VLQKTVFLSRACDRRIDEVHGLIAGNPSSIPIPTFPNYILRVAVDSHPLPGRIIVRPRTRLRSPTARRAPTVRNLRTAGQSSKNGHLHITPENCAAADQSQHTAGIRLHAVAFRVKDECRVPGLWTIFSGSSEMGYGFGFGTRIAYNMCQSGHG
jgi:hypothetical protein